MEENQVKYEQFKEGRLISLSDMVEDILKKIWFILILAIVGALLCAGYKYVHDKKVAESVQDSSSDLSDQISEDEERKIYQIYKLYNSLCSQEEYIENSTLMQIDPYNEDQVNMVYMIKSLNGTGKDVLYAMEAYINQGGLAVDLRQKNTKLDTKYLAELVSCRLNIQDTTGTNIQSDTGYSDSNIILIQVIHSDEDSCKQLAGSVKDCILSYQGKLESSLGENQIELLEDSYTKNIDRDLYVYQSDQINSLLALQSNFLSQKQTLNEEEIQILENDFMGGPEAKINSEVVKESTLEEIVAVHVSKKYAGIGALAGILLGIVLIALRYVVRGTLHLALELPQIFHIPTFGQVNLHENKNILVTAWRRLLNKNQKLTMEEEKNLVILNLIHCCKNNDVNSVLLTGTEAGLSENIFIQEIISRLKEEKIEVDVANSLLWSPDALEKLSQRKNVVLVETLFASRYNEIIQEIQKCMDQKAKIIGSIVLN